MKQTVKIEEVEAEGLLALIDKNVLLMCMNYFYTGKLVGINDTFVKLENASIVYDTGAWSSEGFSDAQALPSEWYVQTSAIESFGLAK